MSSKRMLIVAQRGREMLLRRALVARRVDGVEADELLEQGRRVHGRGD